MSKTQTQSTYGIHRTITAAVVALLAAAPAFADPAGLSQIYSGNSVGFGSHQDDREQFKGFLGKISESSQGALKFQTEDTSRRRRFFGIVTGSDSNLDVSVQMATPEPGPLPGQTLIQQSVDHSLGFSDLVASVASKDGRGDPAVKKCDDSAKRLRALSRRDELKVEADCKVQEIRESKMVADPDRQVERTVRDPDSFGKREVQEKDRRVERMVQDPDRQVEREVTDKIEVKDLKGNISYSYQTRKVVEIIPGEQHHIVDVIPGEKRFETYKIPGQKRKVMETIPGKSHEIVAISHKVDLEYKFIPLKKLSVPSVSPVVGPGNEPGKLPTECDRSNKPSVNVDPEKDPRQTDEERDPRQTDEERDPRQKDETRSSGAAYQ